MTKDQLKLAWGREFYDECHVVAEGIRRLSPDFQSETPPDLVLAVGIAKVRSMVCSVRVANRNPFGYPEDE